MSEILRLGNIKPAGDDNVVVDSKYVKGTFVVVADLQERNNLKGDNGKNIIKGSLCYVQSQSKFYQYDGTDWKEKDLIAKDSINLTLSSMFKYDKSSGTLDIRTIAFK